MTRPNTTTPPNTERAGRETIPAHDQPLLHITQEQNARLAATFDDLFGNGGAPDETADDIIRAVRRWRDTPSTRSID